MLTTTIEHAEDLRVLPAPGDDQTDAPRRGRSPVAVMALGLALVGLAVAVLVVHLRTNDVPAAPIPLAALAVTDLIYEPGHSSGWHVHPGVHSVVVLSGTLTVYDNACGRQDYGPGQTYVGGRDAHLLRNLGGDDVALAVSYVADPAADGPGHPVPAPNGCGPA
jgi:quercetin dioxygenase-like cupin family protein